MPVVRSIRARRVLAILLSDIHLSLRPPLARAEEPRWLDAMERTWAQVRELVKRHEAIVLCAGDVFDRWNMPPELINWALEKLPTMFAVPGNHDLPSHRIDLAHRSAYGTLVRAGKVIELGPKPVWTSELMLYGRPFGGLVPKRDRKTPFCLHVLVTHQYLWVPGTQHHEATRATRLSKSAREFRAFDVVVVGDNHQGFDRVLKNGTRVVNCGTLLRRKSNEAAYRPRVGLLHPSGEVSSYELDTSEDILTRTVTEDEEHAYEVEGIARGLALLEVSSLSYRENVMRALESRGLRRRVRRIVLEAMDGH